jgi:hypothetical protein
MKGEKYTVRAKVWLYPGMAGWHFVSVGKNESQKIKRKYGVGRRGFGSVPVLVNIGKTSWKTSIFPDKKSGVYVMPLKADVRKKEGITINKTITFSIQIQPGVIKM